MAMYEFMCDRCGKAAIIKAEMSKGPPERVDCPDCRSEPFSPMRRLYQGQSTSIVQLDTVGYIEKAYRGEEIVPSLTTPQVRAIVDSQMRTNHAGRRNNVRSKYGHKH